MNTKVKKVAYCPHCDGVAVIHDRIYYKKFDAILPRYRCTGCNKTFNSHFNEGEICQACSRPI